MKNYSISSETIRCFRSGLVLCTRKPATLEVEFRKGVGSMSVEGNIPVVGEWFA